MDNTENRFKHEGVWYIAVEQYGCRNCAFKIGKSGCKVTFKICKSGFKFTFKGTPACKKEERKDKRDVIFVESDADNLVGEE